ncbi:PAS domain-containing sensor histidine kinase [Geothermobacter hydrogeniphilus]|uniref:histidine kinase n=1 Tax=Geothermobacter hydrogeniphilus TaxID=1969733 RepID=A0A2K2HD81_9BACT|nr:ATP-binding protein [Geothermobacter hydrogeniphilus]PNU21246.1 PAS domain-containing sensor histidine kinase [Geothermobacter hydrogeniphilus]
MSRSSDNIPAVQETRKRRREWILILVVIVLVVLFSRFETELFQFTSNISFSNTVLVLALINLNILLIILFLFLIFRNLFKLIVERRRGVPGARLRSKLVLAFVTLSLVPTMLLYFVSAGFISTTIENWFNTQIENSLQESLEVAQTYYRNSAANALYYADQLAAMIKENKLLNQGNLPQLEALIMQKQKEYNLGIVEVFSATYEELVRATNPHIPAVEFTNPDSDSIREALQGQRITRITPIGKADLIRGIVPIYSNFNPEDIVGTVVVNYYVPYSLVSKMKEISASYEQYKGTKFLKSRIQKGYIIVLLLIALVIIFLATWFGFYLARGITGPLQELAEATGQVAAGKLDVHLEAHSDDEVGGLVQSFNKMTADLRSHQQALRKTNRELRSSNLKLDQRRRYMEIVLSNVTAGVISINKQGAITTINKSATRLLKIAPKRIIGKNFREVVGPTYLPVIKDFLRELVSSGKDSIRKQMNIQIGEQRLTLLVNITTLRDEQDEFMGTVVVFDNLTQLLKAQRMAAWREVARRIAHEIKNPLTPVQLSAQRLRRRYLDRFSDDDSVFDECTRMIINQVDELKNLVNEFSSFARMPASNPTPNDLNKIISDTLILYQEGHKAIQFQFRQDPRVPTFDMDREQIKRVLINLLDNAIDAMHGKGTIEIETLFNQGLQMATFTVADNGEGISAEDKPRLFEPYFSTKKSGTGLGLAIVATIISDHNGYIRVKDNAPRGTRFIVELPVSGQSLSA